MGSEKIQSLTLLFARFFVNCLQRITRHSLRKFKVTLLFARFSVNCLQRITRHSLRKFKVNFAFRSFLRNFATYIKEK